MDKDIAGRAEVLGSIPGQVTLSLTAKNRCDIIALPRRKAAKMDPTTGYTLRGNTARVMKRF